MFDSSISFSAVSVFLAIAAVGFMLLLVSLVFGEIFDHFDGGLDHDLDHGGPGFFSTRVLSVFVTTFGGLGAVGTFYGLSALAASGLGFVSGVALASVIYLFGRFLYWQQASTDVKAADMVGQTARVVVGIPSGGVGQVRCRVGEELIDKIARSHDGDAVPENSVVRVEDVLGEVIIVRRQ